MTDGPWSDYADTGPWADYGHPPVTAASLKASNPAEYDPASAAFQDRNGPTGSFGQNLAAGGGQVLSGMYLGLRQMLGLSPGSAAAEKAQTDAPLLNTWGGRIGQIGGTIAAGAPLALIPGANLAAGAALGGAAVGALQPADSALQRYGNLATGGALGYMGQVGVGALSSRLAPNVPAGFVPPEAPASELTSAQQKALSAGQSIGMQATPGQRSGNVALQQFEAKLSSSPYTSDPFNKIAANNQSAVNRTWAAKIGEGGQSVDSEVLGKAADRLGDIFESVRNPNKIVMADPAATTGVLDSIDQSVSGLLPGNASIRSNPLVSQLETLTKSGAVNGEQLGQLSSKLGKAAYKQMTGQGGDRDMGQALYAVKDHVDDLLQSTLNGPEASAYAAARQQYRGLMQLTARVGNVNPSTGNVGAGSMANYLQQTDRNGFLFGGNQSDAYNAVRFAQAFKPVVGNSGTATRSHGLTETALAIPGGFLSRAYLGGRGPISSPVGSAVRGAIRLPGAVGSGVDAASEALAPYARAGLPGMSGGLIPYLTQ